MRRSIALFLLFFALCSSILAQKMSDDQVIMYIKTAQQQGKSQTQMTTELMRRGVTKEQVERIKAQHEGSTQGDAKPTTTSRQRSSNTSPKEKGTLIQEDEEESAMFFDDFLYQDDKEEGRKIFGRDYFSNQELSFEPNSNIATPINYRLGPGDEVIIDIWGDSESTIREEISPDGNIHINQLGPVYLTGMTIKEAESYMSKRLSTIYSALSDNSSQVKLTLGQIRTIQVSIMGEVAYPGTYRLSSFATLFHALYQTGGVNSIGSMRNIQLFRAGRKIADIDAYKYILEGKSYDEIRLMEDDVIIVPTYESLVNITGKVKRPMFYEMKSDESVATLLGYAGGFTGDAYKNSIRLIRSSGREKQVFTIDEMDFSIFKVNDEDSISVEAILDRFENSVEIIGAVYREGMYQIGNDVRTVKQLLAKADGLKGDAFLNRAQLQREHEDLTFELIPIDLKGIINGTAPDIPLQRNDIVYIPSIHDIREEETVTIHGLVADPGTYSFAVKTTVEDLIIQAGGLLEAASTARVDISRRIKDPKGVVPSKVIGQTYSFEIKDGYILEEGSNFYLQPFDEVYIRKSPLYYKQQNVGVFGEVLFDGVYALSQKNERLSDLIAKAGGVTAEAYIKGARLTREMTEEEKKRKESTLRLAQLSSRDSIPLDQLDLSTTYSVGINLEAALKNPGSDFDLVLREGDKLFIPEYLNTVKINGAVMYPNTVSFKKGSSMKYYLNQAGGYNELAKKRKAYIVYMNGTVSRIKKSNSSLIEPGSEIVIPSKDEKRRMSTGEIVGMGTTVASFAAVITSLINTLK